MNYEAFFKISYGLYIISSSSGNKKNGFIGNTVFQVTAEPAQIAMCCSKNNFTLGLIRESKAFSISIYLFIAYLIISIVLSKVLKIEYPIIALTGLITGIAASLSMGASEYLSVKSEGQSNKKDPIKASVYTGVMYLVTVAILITPYFIFSSIYLSLAVTLCNAVTIILFFTFYISVAQDLPFKKRFLEMAGAKKRQIFLFKHFPSN